MPLPEVLAWKEFYKLYPFDDRYRYHRPAAMVAAAWGGDIEKRLEWLQPEPVVEAVHEMSAADLSVMRAFAQLKGKPRE